MSANAQTTESGPEAEGSRFPTLQVVYLLTWCDSYLVETASELAEKCAVLLETAKAAHSATKDCVDWLLVVGNLSSEPSDAERFVSDRDLKIPYVFDHDGRIAQLFGLKTTGTAIRVDRNTGEFVIDDEIMLDQFNSSCH